MELKESRKRLGNILKQTITLLCRDALEYDVEFSVETFIGIKIDHKEGFFLTFKDVVDSISDKFDYTSDAPTENQDSILDKSQNTAKKTLKTFPICKIETSLQRKRNRVGKSLCDNSSQDLQEKRQKLEQNYIEDSLRSFENITEYSEHEKQNSLFVYGNLHSPPAALNENWENSSKENVVRVKIEPGIEKDSNDSLVAETVEEESNRDDDSSQKDSYFSRQDPNSQNLRCYVVYDNKSTIININKLLLTLKNLRAILKKELELNEMIGLKLHWFDEPWKKWNSLKDVQTILHLDEVKLNVTIQKKRNITGTYESTNVLGHNSSSPEKIKTQTQGSFIAGIGIKLSTVQHWQSELDPKGEWLCHVERSGMVTTVYCQLCRKYESNLKSLRNFNTSFLKGISGSSLKKDNCSKHAKSSLHEKAISLKKQEETDIVNDDLRNCEHTQEDNASMIYIEPSIVDSCLINNLGETNSTNSVLSEINDQIPPTTLSTLSTHNSDIAQDLDNKVQFKTEH